MNRNMSIMCLLFFLYSVCNFAFVFACIESFQNDVIVYSPSFKYKIDLVGWLRYFFLQRKYLCLIRRFVLTLK